MNGFRKYVKEALIECVKNNIVLVQAQLDLLEILEKLPCPHKEEATKNGS